MSKTPKTKTRIKTDKRRDELAKLVLNMPPRPKPPDKEKRPDHSGRPH